MSEHDIPSTTTEVREDHARRDRSRLYGIGRATLLVVALLAAWGLLGVWWVSGEEDALFAAGRVTVTVGLLVLSGLWIASIRVPALRRALLPFEAAIVVGAAVFAGGGTGHEVDTTGDIAFIAIAVAIGTSLLVAFVTILLAGRRSEPAWVVGTMVTCAALGLALPAAADRLSSNADDLSLANAQVDHAVLDRAVLARITDDGFVRLGGPPAVDVGMPSSAFAVSGPAPSPVDPVALDPSGASVSAVPAAAVPATAIPAMYEAAVVLVADGAGALQLRVPASLGRRSERTLVEVRRGGCDPDGAGALLLRTSFTAGAAERIALPKLTLDELDLNDRLAARVGTGAPLARVSCSELLTFDAVAIARNGGVAFAAECIRPLRLPAGERLQLTESSLQDARCAKRLGGLGRLIGGAIVPGTTRARFERCLGGSERGNAEVRALHGGGVAVRLRDPSVGVVGDRFMTCTTPGAASTSTAPDPEFDSAEERAAMAEKLR